MTPSEEAAIREELEKAASLISGARRLMSEGRTVDLSALEERMRAIDTAVRAASPQTAKTFTEHLNALMTALDSLEADLNVQHQQLETGLDSIRRREGLGAYQGAPGQSTPGHPPPEQSAPDSDSREQADAPIQGQEPERGQSDD